jgi:hypothetical protein
MSRTRPCLTPGVAATSVWKPIHASNHPAPAAEIAPPIYVPMIDAENTNPVARRPVFHSL